MSAALFDAFPSLRATLPVTALGRFPTRVHAAPGLAPPSVELWIKRDDASSGVYGGNKVRKLEFLLGDALARGKSGLVTVGGFGSHHVLATGIHGRGAGLSVDAVVFPQPITPHVLETVRAGAAAGIRYHAVAGFAAVAPKILALRSHRGRVWIGAGGSSALGSLGYVACGLELAAQIARAECPAFDDIYVALGSQGTVAGLLVGLRLAGIAARVVGVQVVDRIVCSRGGTLRLARRTARLLGKRAGVSISFAPGDFVYEPGFFGGAYGVPSPEASLAVERAATVGLSLETTYTGKAMAALLSDAAAGRLDGRRVLFLDTFSSVPIASILDAGAAAAPLPPRLAALFCS